MEQKFIQGCLVADEKTIQAFDPIGRATLPKAATEERIDLTPYVGAHCWEIIG